MAEAGPTELRIYCICGQKMRVNSAMFGRPGKCVACRQKIRIPRADELEGDSGELYLKDHPEFLRIPVPASDVFDQTPQMEEEHATADDEGPMLPLDVLEPLRTLCSLEQKIQARLENFRSSDPLSLPGDEKTTLMRYRSLVRQAREDLDQRMKARLVEIGEEAARVEDDITRAILSARTGELTVHAFHKQVKALRQRRDYLERNRQNLKGWLNVRDPYEAGGFADLSLDDVPTETPPLVFPPEPRYEHGLIAHTITELRRALEQQERADARLVEWRRMIGSGSVATPGRADLVREYEAQRARAKAVVAFVRERVEQAARDCESDVKSTKAQLAIAREKYQQGNSDRRTYQETELELLKVQDDLNKTCAVLSEAAKSKSPQEVPALQQTLFDRIATPQRTLRAELDSWVAWMACPLMILGTLLPILNSRKGGNMMVLEGFVMTVWLVALLVAALAAIPNRKIRGLVLLGTWTVTTIAAIIFIQQTSFSESDAGIAMREHLWLLNPGSLLLICSSLLILTAGWMPLFRLPSLRMLPVGALGLAGFSMLLILSDFAGALSARPVLAEPMVLAQQAGHNAEIVVQNHGRRPFWLGGQAVVDPTPVKYTLQEMGGEDWVEGPLPVGVKPGRQQSWTTLARDDFQAVKVDGGDEVRLAYALKAGTYEVALTPQNSDSAQVHTFEVRDSAVLAPPPPRQQPVTPPPVAQEPPPPVRPDQSRVEYGPTVEMELTGVIKDANQQPRFFVTVYPPDGSPMRHYISLGEVIHGNWIAKEFSQATQRLTVSDGAQLLVVGTGERLRLAS